MHIFKRWFEVLLEAAGQINIRRKVFKKIYSSSNKKTFITRMLEVGVPLHDVKALGEHRNISSTLNYYTTLNREKMQDELEQVKIINNPAL
ncbi:MAG: hypothetical protein CMF23_03650 [Ignavibacteriae bacterium]|nr:hypothetical protein [Ignavibacteriota bacterium]